jgi:hypothetical protein
MTYELTRAADLDRSKICATLDRAFADGQLDAAEHEERVNRAMAAKTLAELHPLVADLQPIREHAPVEPTNPGRRALIAIGVAGLVIGAGLAAFVIGRPGADPPAAQAYHYSAPVYVPSSPIVASVPQLMTVDGFDTFLADTRKTFGDTMITRLSVFGDNALVTRPAAGSDARVQMYNYRGGYPAPTFALRPPDAADVDLAKLNVPKIMGLVAGAAQSLHVDSPATVSFDIDGRDGGTVTIHARNTFAESGTLVLGIDGTVRQVYSASK